MKKIFDVLVILILLTLILPVNFSNAGDSGLNIDIGRPKRIRDVEIYGLVENFVWQERDNGEKLLEENGWLGGVGITGKLYSGSHEIIAARGEISSGKTIYDGSIQSGDKAITTTDYIGMKLEADHVFHRGLGQGVFIEPYVGGGYRWWLRDISDGVTVNGDTATGYAELWQTLYLRAGMRGDKRLRNNLTLISSIGLSLPFYTTNKVMMNGIDMASPDFTLNPGGKISLNADAGISMNRIKILLFYDQMRFSRSDSVSIGGGLYFYQPESRADIFGVRIGAEL